MAVSRHDKISRLLTCFLVISLVVSPIALLLLTISFSTEYWLIITVDRDVLTEDQIRSTTDIDNLDLGRVGHTRAIGIFWECYFTNTSEFLEKAPGIHSRCFQVEYLLPKHKQKKHFSFEYWQRLQLKRIRLASMVIALASCLTSYIIGIYLWNYGSYRTSILACIFMVIAAFMISLAMALFHAVEYIEVNTIKDTNERLFQINWPLFIKNASSRTYGWSYILSWVAMGLSTIPASLYGLIAFQLKADEYHNPTRDHSAFSDFMDGITTISKATNPHFQAIYNQKYSPHDDKAMTYALSKKENSIQDLQWKGVAF